MNTIDQKIKELEEKAKAVGRVAGLPAGIHPNDINCECSG